MLILLFLFSLFACVHPCEDTCAHPIEESAITTAEVVADMRETLDKSKKFLSSIETTLREFVLDLETKMVVDSRQLEKAQLAHTRREACALEKAFEKKLAAKTEEFCAANVTKEQCVCEQSAFSWPANACLQLIHSNNSTLFMNITGYPTRVAQELDLSNTPSLQYFDEEAKKVIIRPGCMATMWMHSHNDRCEEMRGLSDIEAGEYELKTYSTGTLDVGVKVNGVSAVHCMCDPMRTEANAKQDKKDCIKNHVWNPKTKRCDSFQKQDVCAEVYNHEGSALSLNIENWPLIKRFDMNFAQAVALKAWHLKFGSIRVRNGCFATMYTGNWLDSSKTLETVGYGVHAVLDGTTRVICQCMNDDSKKDEYRVATPHLPNCIANHKFDEVTKRCEWTAPETSCIELASYGGQKTFVNVGANNYGIIDLSKLGADWNYKAISATVRQGCMATFWSMMHSENKDSEITLLSNVEYGYYWLHEIDRGTSAGGNLRAGVISASCLCDPTRMKVLPPVKPHPVCLPNHVYDENTGACEWKLNNNICGEIENHEGVRMPLVIPNWPHNKRYSVNFIQANITSFARKESETIDCNVTSISVRQHCFASIYDGTHLASNNILPVKTYGQYNVTSFYNGSAAKEEQGAQRVICECMY